MFIQGKTLKQVLNEVSVKYAVNFSYSDNILPKGIILQGPAVYTSLVKLLDQHFVPRGVSYKYINGQIVLFAQELKMRWCYLNGFLIDSLSSESVINVCLL
jgi:capsule polysaccharide modification protein KpsS